jgi:formamidopyrimidine-DNA glycosylase
MPELPEVETIRLGLQETIVGQEIAQVSVVLPKMFIGDTAVLIGCRFTSTKRRGKLLILGLQKGMSHFSLLIHLKMTGQLLFRSLSIPVYFLNHPIPPLNTLIPNKSTKVIITFASGDTLYFNDI